MISDKAVEAAARAHRDAGFYEGEDNYKARFRAALQAALPVLLEGKAEEIARVIDPGAWTNADQNGREWAEEHTEILLSIAKANRIISVLTGGEDER